MTSFPGVAKFGIALEWGSRGLEFESRHSDQKPERAFALSGFSFVKRVGPFKCRCPADLLDAGLTASTQSCTESRHTAQKLKEQYKIPTLRTVIFGKWEVRKNILKIVKIILDF